MSCVFVLLVIIVLRFKLSPRGASTPPSISKGARLQVK
jgi:hypothetical protein